MVNIIFIFIFQFQRSRFDGAMNFLSSLHQMVADASSSLQVNTELCDFSITLAVLYILSNWLLVVL